MKTLLDIDPRLKVRKLADLIDEPVILRVAEFNDEAATKFSRGMARAHRTGQPIIPVVINSYGGEVYSLLAMMAEIDNAKLPVATICVGKAMSCGAFLLGCGTAGHRYCSPRASVMLHDLASGTYGKTTEMAADVKEVERLKKQVFEMLAEKCGRHKLHFFQELKNRQNADWYMKPTEARREGLVDHLRVPNFRVRISVGIEVE